MQSASDSLQSTLDNEDQNNPMVEAKNRGIEAALKFKMGGCCKICETRFYRDLAFLEVSESYKLEAVKRFHAWHAYGRPVGHNSNPILHEEKIIAHAPRGKALIDVHNAFLEVAEEVKNEKAMKEKKDDQGEGKNELGNSGNAFVFLQENNHNQLLVKKGQSSSNMEDSNSLNSRKGGGSSKSQPSGGGSKGGSKPSGGGSKGGSGGGGKKSGDGAQKKGSNKGAKADKKASNGNKKTSDKAAKADKKSSDKAAKADKKASDNAKKSSDKAAKSAKKSSEKKAKSAKKASEKSKKASEKKAKSAKKASEKESKSAKKSSGKKNKGKSKAGKEDGGGKGGKSGKVDVTSNGGKAGKAGKKPKGGKGGKKPKGSKGGKKPKGGKSGKRGKVGKTKTPPLPATSKSMGIMPCCSLCAPDFLPAPKAASLSDNQNFADPDPTVGLTFSKAKNDPVPCCKICDTSMHSNIDYARMLEPANLDTMFIEKNNNPFGGDAVIGASSVAGSFASGKDKKATSKPSKTDKKDKDSKDSKDPKNEVQPHYLDVNHCSKLREDDDHHGAPPITCSMCPAKSTSSALFSDPRSTNFQDVNNDPMRKNHLNAKNPHNHRSYPQRRNNVVKEAVFNTVDDAVGDTIAARRI